MKLSQKRLLSGFMIAGDIFMMLVAMMLIFEEELFIIGMMMLGFLAVDIYLTIDYIRSLRHREKVESSLKADNERLARSRREWSNMNLRRNPQRRQNTQYQTAPQRDASPAQQAQSTASSQRGNSGFRQAAVPPMPPTPPAPLEEEEELADVLRSPASPENGTMRG